MKFPVSLIILLISLLPSISNASCFSLAGCDFLPGIYIGASGGLNGGTALHCRHVKTDRGCYAGLKIGKKLFSLFRFEEELLFQWNHVNSLKDGIVQFNHIRGDIHIWSLMTNALFDIPFNCCLPGRPYLGGGIGYSLTDGHWSGDVIDLHQHLRQDKGKFNPLVAFSKEHWKYHKGGFAWQFIAGLKFTFCLEIDVSVEYRFFKQEGSLSNHKFGFGLSKGF